MKTFRFFGIALAAILLSTTACSDEGGKDITLPQQSEIKIDSSITTNGVSFSAKAEEKSVSFTTNEKWTLSVAETRNGTSWCTPSATSGNAGNVSVTFKVKENTEYDDRSVAITIKAGTASITFKITQKGVNAMLVTTTIYEVTQKGATIDIEVQANIDYKMEIAEAAQEWITDVTSRALTKYKHSLKIAASEEYDKREGEIYFTCGEKKDTVHVYQSGGAILLLSQNEYTVSNEGESITVEIKSNFEYDVQMPEVDWIKEETTRGVSSHTLKYTIKPNESYENRSAQIVYYDKNSELKDTLTIKQAQKDSAIQEGDLWIVTKSKAGNLQDLLGDDLLKITSLKITGPLNGDDIKVLRQMLGGPNLNVDYLGNLTTLDLTNASIVEGGNCYYHYYADLSFDYTKHYTRNNTIGEYMFYGCVNLHSILLPKSITEIDSYAFKGSSLINLTLPNSVITIRNSAFYECRFNITLPSSVITIEELAFWRCFGLTNIKIPEGVVEIADWTFADCKALTNVTIPNSVKIIGGLAFGGCSSLTSITIPNSVTIIGMNAFSSCSSLIDITLPNSITEIGRSVFMECSSLNSITIPDSVKTIQSHSFYGCTDLTKVVIPNSVIMIEDYAFSQCYRLTKFNSYATVPPKIESPNFDKISDSATLYIPKGTKEKYQLSDWGKIFKNIIEMD